MLATAPMTQLSIPHVIGFEDASGSDSVLKRFAAICIVSGNIRRITFEARTLVEAREFAAKHEFGIEGEVPEEATRSPEDAARESPDAFDVPEACRKLGGISRAQLYRFLKRGKLARLPDTRKVLVTRSSIERYLSRAA